MPMTAGAFNAMPGIHHRAPGPLAAAMDSDGVYVQADAEIISSNTVKIKSEFVAEPKSASYACCLTNIRSNLFATENGSLALPVSPFVTDKAYTSHFWADKIWADCENSTFWHNAADDTAKYYDTWSAEGAVIEFNDCLNIKATQNNFSVKPVMTYDGGNLFVDMDNDYSDYGKMTFRIRNNGAEDISLDSIKIKAGSIAWYNPAFEGTAETGGIIPADGEWHTVTIDLSSLYLYGNECGITFPSKKLEKVTDIQFIFSGNNADISIDEIRFAPVTENVGLRFNANIKNADNFSEILSALFVGFIGLFVNLF